MGTRHIVSLLTYPLPQREQYAAMYYYLSILEMYDIFHKGNQMNIRFLASSLISVTVS